MHDIKGLKNKKQFHGQINITKTEIVPNLKKSHQDVQKEELFFIKKVGKYDVLSNNVYIGLYR